MRVVEPRHEILMCEPKDLKLIETAGRVCYKSEGRIGEGTAEKFAQARLNKSNPHESVIEHSILSVRFICDRGLSHEIVRHRLAAYSQESTRYCNYSGFGIEVIHPSALTEVQKRRREDLFWNIQRVYDAEILEGQTPQIARGVLPTALKTEIIMTANFREWRYIFRLRIARAAHPQMIELLFHLLKDVQLLVPVVFDDIDVGAQLW